MIVDYMNTESMSTESKIQQKAYDLGYEKCGIIRIEDMEGFDLKLLERMEKVPSSRPFYQRQERLTKLKEQYPWAKSIIVAVSHYGHYKLPEHLTNHIAKLYLYDPRSNQTSKEYLASEKFEEYVRSLGFQIASERKFGLVGLRWAGMKAGIGIIRRNNFFYTESGSWVELEAWITDQELELIETNNLKVCPAGCTNCIKACPTCSLSEPYTMNPLNCISFLTTFGGRDMSGLDERKKFGSWYYGCDVCQDACPMNHKKWTELDEFPHDEEVLRNLTPENIMNMNEDYYRTHIQPRFFYLTSDDLWKWKVNVLNYMQNNYIQSYTPYITKACGHHNPKIRELANKIAEELALSPEYS